MIEKLNEIEQDKEDIENYNKYVKAYKIFEKNENLNLIDPEYLILLYEYDFEHYNIYHNQNINIRQLFYNIG